MQLTYKFRLRDTADSELRRQSRAVSYVWNYCNETQQQAVKRGRKWLSWHDLQKLTAGSSKELLLTPHGERERPGPMRCCLCGVDS